MTKGKGMGEDLSEIIEWDIPNWSVALEYWKKNSAQKVSPGNALEVGSRHGGLSLWAAQQGMRVFCTDLKGPSEMAVAKHYRHNVSHMIRYAAVDVTNMPYDNEFDVVMLKSVLGGVGRNHDKSKQIKAVQEIYRSLKKGGELWFAENCTASPVHQFFRKRFLPWGDSWRYVTVSEMKDNLSIFSEFKYITVGFLGALGRTPLQRWFLGKMDRFFVDKWVPESWRYIIIGVARK